MLLAKELIPIQYRLPRVLPLLVVHSLVPVGFMAAVGERGLELAFCPVQSARVVEVLKEITGTGETLAGHLLIYDAKDARFERVSIAWDPDNALSGRHPTILDLTIHEQPTPGAARRAPA